MSLFAERIGGAQFGKAEGGYKFARIKAAKQEAMAANPGVELLDFGVGEPDSAAPQVVMDALVDELRKHENRGYADNGSDEFNTAAAGFMKTLFNVDLGPGEVLHSIGSKAALAMLPACFINPGDKVLTTTPGYPVFAVNARYYGAEIVELPLCEENGFLPDLDNAPTDAKVLVINYPNNPTGACATREFFQKAVAWAKANNILIIQDAAYAALQFEGTPLSILQIPGAKDCCLELHSLSKTFNMTGWRIAWVCGGKHLIDAYGHVKDNTDSGQFLGIQKAAIKALEHPELIEPIKAKYHRRLTRMAEVLNNCGFTAKIPAAGFFLYVSTPSTYTTAEAFSQALIKESLISTVPWDDAGNYIRFSATFIAKNEAEETRVLDELERRLQEFGQ